MEKPPIEPDMSAAIEVIRHVGAWMRDSGIANYSDWWDPDKVSPEMLAAYAKPEEFYVVKVEGQPAAAVIIQREQSLQDWSSIDKDTEAPSATYIHYVAVEREFAGRGLVGIIMDKADEIAKQQGTSVLRLDTNADEPKLCAIYERLGFNLVGTLEEEGHNTAFYEKPVIYSEMTN